EKVREAQLQLTAEGTDPEFAKAVATYLAISIDGIADHGSTMCQWRGGTEDAGHTFGRQALPMSWDYAEVNPISGSTGSWSSMQDRLLRVLYHLTQIQSKGEQSTPLRANVFQGTATELPWPENFFNAVIADPPYYDNVPYADLSDFFYVWLKRAIGDAYPELF